MPYTAVTKPSVGDPIKLSTIEAIIDNQAFFNSSLSSNVSFGADGDFEATPTGSDPALGWTDGGGPVTFSRSSSAGDPNISGQYCLKASGDAGDTNYIESDLFPIAANETYLLDVTTMVDTAGDKWTVEFISYERDGATGPVQTVKQPEMTKSTGEVGMGYTSGMTRKQWVVDGGSTGRWAKIKITFTVNSSTASDGYIDLFRLDRTHNGIYRFVIDDYNDNSGNSLSIYIPRNYATVFHLLNSSDLPEEITAVWFDPKVSGISSKFDYGNSAGYSAGTIVRIPGTDNANKDIYYVSQANNSGVQGSTVTVGTTATAGASALAAAIYYVPEFYL